MQKEAFSSLMDGELVKDDASINALLLDKELSAYWYRCHIIRDAMRHRLHSQTLTFELSEKVLQAIADMDFDSSHQLLLTDNRIGKGSSLYPTIKLFFGRLSQVGLAACVALLAVGGIQYYNYSTIESSTKIPSLNTMPIGISIAPVGGLSPLVNPKDATKENSVSRQEYEKIYFLLQNHELQRRINTTR